MDADEAERRAAIAVALRALLAAAPDVQAALARRLDMGTTDVAALDHVVGAAEIGPVELGHRLGIRSASATVLVDRLQARGHLERAPHPGDGRRVTLRATPAARTEIRAALAPLLAGVDAVSRTLRPDEADTIVRFLGRVETVMRGFAADEENVPGD